MMIKLYAINIVAGRYAFKRLPKGKLKEKVREQVELMVDDEEMLAQLLAE